MPVNRGGDGGVGLGLVGSGAVIGTGLTVLSALQHFEDSFARPDAPTLGPDWDDPDGAFQILDNSAQLQLGVDAIAGVVGWSSVDQEISAVSVYNGSGTLAGLVARFDRGAMNGYFVWVQEDGTGATISWGTVDAGVFHAVDSAGPLTPGIRSISLRLVGSGLVVQWNGVTVLTATDSTYTGPGQVGITVDFTGFGALQDFVADEIG